MLLPKPQDTIHKAWLYRLLTAIYDDPNLPSLIYFKGGTCAAMLGYLNRFSVDLDFDFAGSDQDLKLTHQKLEAVFNKLGLEIKDQSQNVPQYFLKYPSQKSSRNTIKIDITLPPPKANTYQTVRFTEIDRIITCQIIETMFANKLVALIDRYEKNNSIAGRDLYDIHYFFMQGFTYHSPVIEERRGTDVKNFIQTLIEFIQTKITQTIINQDLNFLLPDPEFQKIRHILKPEVLMMLGDELKRLE